MPRSRRRRAALAAGGGGVPAPSVTIPAALTQQEFTVGRFQSSIIVSDRVENPDEVIKQFGGWEGLSFYARMLRQFPFLVGICMQWIASINSIDRAIKAGEPGDEESERLAKDARYLYSRVDRKEVINEHLLWGKFYGFSPVEKVWEKDPATGLLAPTKLFDLKPWQIKFKTDGTPCVLTAKEPMNGEPVTEPRRLMFFRWGSLHSGYGEGTLKYAYMPTWYIQQVLRFGVQAIERFGRPIPWVRYWRNLEPSEKSALQTSLAAQFKYYVMTPSDDPKTDLQFPAINITANGMAGKAEQDFCRYMEGWCYIALNLTQQTQDKSGGSRALESTRREIAMDQTPPGSQALDNVWNRHWLDEIGEVNWPSVPRSKWPRFDSDVDGADYIDGSALAAIADISAKLVAKQMTETWAIEELVRAGFPRMKAIEMVKSAIKERDTLKPVLPAANPFAPTETDEKEEDEPTEENVA
jgi:hypothetical protein